MARLFLFNGDWESLVQPTSLGVPLSDTVVQSVQLAIRFFLDWFQSHNKVSFQEWFAMYAISAPVLCPAGTPTPAAACTHAGAPHARQCQGRAAGVQEPSPRQPHAQCLQGKAGMLLRWQQLRQNCLLLLLLLILMMMP